MGWISNPVGNFYDSKQLLFFSYTHHCSVINKFFSPLHFKLIRFYRFFLTLKKKVKGGEGKIPLRTLSLVTRILRNIEKVFFCKCFPWEKDKNTVPWISSAVHSWNYLITKEKGDVYKKIIRIFLTCRPKLFTILFSPQEGGTTVLFIFC